MIGSWADRLLWAAVGAAALFAYQHWSEIQLARKAGDKVSAAQDAYNAIGRLFGGSS